MIENKIIISKLNCLGNVAVPELRTCKSGVASTALQMQSNCLI